MLRPDDVFQNSEDQDAGRELHLVDPFTGQPSGIVLVLAGPDSATARRARIALADRLAEMADHDGRVSAEHRATARQEALLALIIRGFAIDGDGKNETVSHLPIARDTVRRLVSTPWVEEQADAFAADRRNYRSA
jgi:hypothetical protein